MKKLILLFVVIITFVFDVYSQQIELPGKGEITLKEVSSDTVYYLPIKILKRPKSGNLIINFTDENQQTETASKGKDYDYVENEILPRTISNTSPDYFSIGIIIKSRKIKRDVLNFVLIISFKVDGNDHFEKLKVSISPLIPIIDKKEIPDTSKWSVRIVTGSNFDFFDAPTFKNFAGDIAIWTPDLFQFKINDKKISLGLQAGFFNYRYFEADTSKGKIQTEKFLFDGGVTKLAIDTTKYIREVYALNSKTSYNTVGAYLNPIVTLKTTKWIDLYLSLHIEALWRTEIQEYTKVAIRKDTFLLSSSDVSQGIILGSYSALRPIYSKKSYNDSYVGLGLPFKINIKNLFQFYLAPTIGLASFESTNITEETRGSIRYRIYKPTESKDLFLLTKAQLVTSIAPIEIALGGEFRKIRNQKTFYALYLGAALSLDKLKK